MGRKNAFLTKIQQQNDAVARDMTNRMANWVRQACGDALYIMLTHCRMIYGKNLSDAKARECLAEWDEIFHMVFDGLSCAPDADFKREKTDRLLKEKLPPEMFDPWPKRYVDWNELNIGEEAERFRRYWQKNGLLAEDTVTTELLKGIGKTEVDA